MTRAILRGFVGFVSTVLIVSVVTHATETLCQSCGCSGSALSDDWHYSVCNWGGDCSLHPGTQCSNVGH
jgi:hypothetical protein